MQARTLVAAVVASGVVLLGVDARPPLARAAGDTPPAPATGNAQTPAPAATGTSSTSGTAGTTGATGTTEPAKPARAATGYGYGDEKPARGAAPAKSHAAHRAHRTNAPVATLPGFEMLADGGSRLFVQLSKQVEVSEQRGTAQTRARKAKGKKAEPAAPHPTITYVLRGAQVLRRNNENALVTVHFNTPVARARLIPAGHDLHFIVDLRADAAPAWKVVPAKDNTAILQIDFPKGDFLPNGSAPAPEPTSPDAPAPAAETEDTQP